MAVLASDLTWALAVCALIAASPFLLDRVFTRRRTAALEQQARKLGFSFERQADPFAGCNLQGLEVLERDPAALTVNVMRGKVGPCEALVFEREHYNLETPGAPAESTFAAFHCPSGRLPTFEIGEQSWAHRLADAVERKSDLQLCPECGARLFVHCADASRTRDFLPHEKLSTLHLEAQHFCIESNPEWILIFRPGRRVKPEGLPSFVSCAAAVASALLQQGSIPAQPSA
jgi:hypothetical protein